ncbi:MAG: toll/interleukin-1 receptor domain-containing protein [Candidatus Lokiarchaeota archaeon]|nr:toll/interleukin-1 receptor domain-containing protein [Candidatus Lokiarchaeota archaeon]
MELNNGEENLLIKIYIGQRIRSEGLVESSLNSEELSNIKSLIEKKLIENSYWKPFRHYNLYLVSKKGEEIASICIQNILDKSNIIKEVKEIPLIFLKLYLFHDVDFFIHREDQEFAEFYWDEGEREFLIEKGQENRKKLINLFKQRNLCVQSYDYVSTNGGELRAKYNIVPEIEIKAFFDNTFGIKEGLSDDILKRLVNERQEIIKKRENLLFEEIIDDFIPKYPKIIMQDQKKIMPLYEQKGISIFLSYSTEDEKIFPIEVIAGELKVYHDIQDVFYWEKDMDDNIVEYMDKYIEKSDIFILFSSPNAKLSEQVKKEWTAAESSDKIIIPIFEVKEDIPTLLKPRRGLKFDILNLSRFINELHKLILKKLKIE